MNGLAGLAPRAGDGRRRGPRRSGTGRCVRGVPIDRMLAFTAALTGRPAGDRLVPGIGAA